MAYKHSIDVPLTYSLAMTYDGPTAAFEVTRTDPVELTRSRLLRLAAEFDAAASPSMAQHARRVAHELGSASSEAEPAHAVGSPPVTPKISPVM